MDHCHQGEPRSMGSGSILERPSAQGAQTGCVSRLVSPRPLKLQLRQPTHPRFFFSVFSILALMQAFSDLILWVVGKGESGIGISGMGVYAERCSTSELQAMTVSNDVGFDFSRFSCEDGNFSVSWVGVIIVTETIKIGPGTTVRIFGESAAVTSSSSTLTSESNKTEMEVELERLSSVLNLPQGSISAAVADHSSDDPVGPIFSVNSGMLHLESLVVRRGISTYDKSGGGIFAENSNINVSGCLFENNFSENHGGGIYADQSTVTIWNSVFRANSVGFQSYAGVENAESLGGGIACEKTSLYLEGCLFDDNYANKKGGGVSIDEGQVSIVNSLFFNNVAGSNNVKSEDAVGEGAAIFFTNCSHSFDGQSSCSVNDTTFIYNAVAKKGGAVAVSSGSSYIEFHRCVVDNTTTGWPFEDDPQGEGGAFSLGKGTTMVMDDCVVKNNYCGKKGGVFTVSSGDGWDNPGGTIIIRNSTFTGNIAKLNSAGVVNLGEFATARIEGQGNNFTGNVCGLYGGVLAATTDTNVTVEGGLFHGNEADEGGGVFWVKGNFSINGGIFSNNYVSESNGGVVYASDYSFVTLSGGHFEGNDALNGGVAFVELEAVMLVEGGVYTRNIAQTGGGVFWGEDGGDLKITGGVFKDNIADNGGFLYAQGDGNTSCEGASVEKNIAVNGGAIYAVDGAVVECACNLTGNEALSGPAIYARAGAKVIVRGVNVSDNVVAIGSTMVIVSSTLYTYRVNFQDSTRSSDLFAVQSDKDSKYVAEETAFMGFQGEVVVFSEGILYMDDCDFSESSASALVYANPKTTTVIRNAVLGDNNYEAAITEASESSVVPKNASLINIPLTCEESESPCSVGSPCLEGDLGVYCQCYNRRLFPIETCLDGDPEQLFLANKSIPPTTFYPDLLEGDLLLVFDAVDGNGTFVTISTSSTTTAIPSNSAGVVWNATGISQVSISWTVFPSVGILLPGYNITLRVVGEPDEYFDGNTAVDFAVDALGAPNEEKVLSSNSSPFVEDDESEVNSSAAYDMEVTYYHCEEGSFWNLSVGEPPPWSCGLCSGIDGDDEGVDCSSPGVSTSSLPLKSGYWRAALNTTFVRECFNKDACIGGNNVTSVDEYCDTGYKGPYCGVCSEGYGRGSANSCHKCTEEFKGVMYFVLVVVTLLTIVIVAVLAAYLVGGKAAVSQVALTAIISGRTLRRRGFMRPKLGGRNDFGSFSKMASSLKRITFGNVPASGRDTFNENAVVSALSPSATAATVNEAHDVTGHESNTKPVETSDSNSHMSVPKPYPLPAQGLAYELRTMPAIAEETCLSDDGRTSAGVAPSRLSVSVPAAAPVRERGLGGNEREEEKQEGVDDGKEEEPVAAVIGKYLGRLPLSKLKIVIVVWQISSAFTEITDVPFPEMYETFLSLTGIFSFDLSWILSATCMTDNLDFYDKLLIVTIGPLVLLGLLGITFYIGFRDLKLAHRGNCTENINMDERKENTDVNMSSSHTTLFTTINDAKKPQSATQGVVSANELSVRRILNEGPGHDPNAEQNLVWGLFARHTTVTLIILYLVYSHTSTTVFQTFACEDIDETGESYLRSDFSVACNTPKHKAYKIYAALMICVYPLGIPAAFWYFLVKQKSHLNPPMGEHVASVRGEDHVLEKKVEKRRKDPTVASTSFLWAAYYPDRYYFEVCECIRRLLLTGVLVFLEPDTAAQVAYSCFFAFISLFAFELLMPHMDQLDRVLYRTGCLVIFFTNFLALLIKAEVADPDSGGSAAFSIGLIIANISLVILSIWWNTWATIKAMFSRSHIQGMTIGVDIIGEDKMHSLAVAMKGEETKEHGDTKREVKFDLEDIEVPEWEQDPSIGTELPDVADNRHYDQGGRQGSASASKVDSVLNSPTSSGFQASGVVGDALDVTQPLRWQHRFQRQGVSSRRRTESPRSLTAILPAAGNIVECGPKSRGFPYASRSPVETFSVQSPIHTTVNPDGPACRDNKSDV